MPGFHRPQAFSEGLNVLRFFSGHFLGNQTPNSDTRGRERERAWGETPSAGVEGRKKSSRIQVEGVSSKTEIGVEAPSWKFESSPSVWLVVFLCRARSDGFCYPPFSLSSLNAKS